MIQTIIAVFLLSVGVIALSRLTVLYYTKKKIEEAKEELKPSQIVKKADSEDELREKYKKYAYLVESIKERVKFKIGEHFIAMSFAHKEEGFRPNPFETSYHTVTSFIEISHDGWVRKYVSDEYGLRVYEEFKLDADWLIDNDEGFTDSLHEVLRTLAEKGYGE